MPELALRTDLILRVLQDSWHRGNALCLFHCRFGITGGNFVAE
jgi:hypothetical protein